MEKEEGKKEEKTEDGPKQQNTNPIQPAKTIEGKGESDGENTVWEQDSGPNLPPDNEVKKNTDKGVSGSPSKDVPTQISVTSKKRDESSTDLAEGKGKKRATPKQRQQKKKKKRAKSTPADALLKTGTPFANLLDADERLSVALSDIDVISRVPSLGVIENTGEGKASLSQGDSAETENITFDDHQKLLVEASKNFEIVLKDSLNRIAENADSVKAAMANLVKNGAEVVRKEASAEHERAGLIQSQHAFVKSMSVQSQQNLEMSGKFLAVVSACVELSEAQFLSKIQDQVKKPNEEE